MLEFYLMRDDQSKNSASKLLFAGELDDSCFENLKTKGLIPDRFDYYTDFRWGTALVKQLHEKINSIATESDPDAKRLIELLSLAVQNNSGLIAYSD